MAHAWATVRATITTAGITYPGATTTKSYLLDSKLNQRTSGTPGTTFNIDFDFGSAFALVGFAILNHNFNSGGASTVTVTAADDAAFSVNVVTAKAASTLYAGLGLTDPRGKDHVLRFPSVSKRYWRLACAFAASTTPIVGELFPLTAASTNLLSRVTVYGAGETERFLEAGMVLDSGDDRRRFIAGPIRSLRLPWVDLTSAQRDQLLSMWRAARGGSTPVLWIANDVQSATAAAAAEQDCLYGILGQELGWTQPDYLLFDVAAMSMTCLGREVGA